MTVGQTRRKKHNRNVGTSKNMQWPSSAHVTYTVVVPLKTHVMLDRNFVAHWTSGHTLAKTYIVLCKFKRRYQ